jgi:hypothetical protein
LNEPIGNAVEVFHFPTQVLHERLFALRPQFRLLAAAKSLRKIERKPLKLQQQPLPYAASKDMRHEDDIDN